MHEKGFCWVSESQNLIFLPIPKNGSTSIRTIGEFGFKRSNIFFALYSSTKKYTVFSVVRNPLARFVSAYIEICGRATGDSRHILHTSFFWEKDPVRRFYGFMDEVERGFRDAHVRSQEYYLTDYRGEWLPYNKLLRLEHLKEDFADLCNDLNIEFVIPHSNTESSKRRYSFTDTVRNALVWRSVDKTTFPLLIYEKLEKLLRKILLKRPVPLSSTIYEIIRQDTALKNRILAYTEADCRLYEKVTGISALDALGMLDL